MKHQTHTYMTQNTPKHTAGPWRWNGDAVWSEHESVSGKVTKGARTNHVCAVSSRLKMPEPERQANARLIAAAPDLLAALQILLAERIVAGPQDEQEFDADGNWTCTSTACNAARIAISKATGVQS